MSEHKCPYDAHGGVEWDWACGRNGHLCHRCREDRADRRAVFVRDGIQRGWHGKEGFSKKTSEYAVMALHWLATGEWPDD